MKGVQERQGQEAEVAIEQFKTQVNNYPPFNMHHMMCVCMNSTIVTSYMYIHVLCKNTWLCINSS